MDTTEEEKISRKHSHPGFDERLNDLLDILGKKKYGRVSYLREICGFTWGGTKAFIKRDRPPKSDDAWDALTNSFAHNIDLITDHVISQNDVKEYLCSGSGIFSTSEIKRAVKQENKELSKEYCAIEASFQGRVVLLLSEISKEMEIDIFNDFKEDQTDQLIKKFTIICYRSGDTHFEKNEKMFQLARSLILIAKENLM